MNRMPCQRCGLFFMWDGYAPVWCDACLGDEESSSSYSSSDESSSPTSSSPYAHSKPPPKPLKCAHVLPRYPPVLPTKTTRKFYPDS